MTLQQNRANRGPDLQDGIHWNDVQIGERVQLRRNGLPEHVGWVDSRTADGKIVWVTPDGGSRRLFHIDDGYQLAAAAPEGTDDEGN